MASTNRQILDALNAAILARISGGAVQSYRVPGLDVTKDSLDSLTKARDKYQVIVDRENGNHITLVDLS